MVNLYSIHYTVCSFSRITLYQDILGGLQIDRQLQVLKGQSTEIFDLYFI